MPAGKDRVLSQITRIMYSYNLTIDLKTGNYSLITGTGMERTVDEYKRHGNMSEIKAFQNSIIHPSYLQRFKQLTDFSSARIDPTENGYRGTLEYPVIYPGDDEFEWHEINVFVNTEENGARIANILGRDVTAAHRAQIPIIAMTANAFEEDKRNAIKSGMNGHIAKPINVGELMSVLAQNLGGAV